MYIDCLFKLYKVIVEYPDAKDRIQPWYLDKVRAFNKPYEWEKWYYWIIHQYFEGIMWYWDLL